MKTENPLKASPSLTPTGATLGAEIAQDMGLRYVTDDVPGIRRLPAGSGFRYLGTDGKPLRDAATLQRIKSLVIPPAWIDVWICPLKNGHIQFPNLGRHFALGDDTARIR